MKQSVTALFIIMMVWATSAQYDDFFADEHGDGDSYDDENYGIDYYEKNQDLNAPAAAAAADVAAALAAAADGENIIVATTAAATVAAAAATTAAADDDDEEEEEDTEEEEKGEYC